MATIQWFPGHMSKARRQVQENLKHVDFVTILVDARLPLSSQNPMLTKIVGDKPKILILNKADLADDNRTKEWRTYFESQGIKTLAINSKEQSTVKLVTDAAKSLMADKIQRLRERGIQKETLRTMIIGIPNAGKSTLMNRLAGKKIAVVGNKPGVTKGQQWLKSNKDLEILDTPGILWPKFDDEAIGMKLACVGSISDEVLNMQEIAYHLLSYGKANYNQLFEARYGAVPQPDDERDNEIVLWMENIARQRGCLKRGAETDFDKVSAQITDDFRSGRIGKVSLEVPKQA